MRSPNMILKCSKCFTRSCDFSGLQLKNTLFNLF
jgi:hypothetical protein